MNKTSHWPDVTIEFTTVWFKVQFSTDWANQMIYQLPSWLFISLCLSVCIFWSPIVDNLSKYIMFGSPNTFWQDDYTNTTNPSPFPILLWYHYVINFIQSGKPNQIDSEYNLYDVVHRNVINHSTLVCHGYHGRKYYSVFPDCNK